MSKASGKTFTSGARRAFSRPSAIGHEIRVFAHVDDDVLRGVASEDDDGIFEIDGAAFAIFHPALVKDLEKDFVHIRMGLFDFIEQDDAVGAAAHSLGEDTAFAVADITGRRAFERADGVGLLEFGHVDGDKIVFSAIESLGERQGGLGLAGAAGAGEHENADGPIGIIQAGAAGLNAAGDRFEGVALADDAAFKMIGELEHLLDFVVDHATDRDAGPIGDDAGDGVLVHAGKHQRRLALERRELFLRCFQFGEERIALFGRQRVLGTGSHSGFHFCRLGVDLRPR